MNASSCSPQCSSVAIGAPTETLPDARIVYKGEISVPAAFTVFPGEIWRAPRNWVERANRDLIYFHEVDKGGHFAAWKQQLFVDAVRLAFRSLR